MTTKTTPAYARVLLDGNSFCRAAFDPQHAGSMAHRVGQRILTLRETQPVVVAWDVAPRERLEHFPGYKAARRSSTWEYREAYNEQRAAFQRLLRMIDIPQVVAPRWEADDALATLAAGEDLTQIQTRDEDLLQTITETNHVLLIKVSKEKNYDARTFTKERGYAPELHIDYKAMAGDSSDSIPGVNGIGDKAALEILKKYPDAVQHILDGTELAPANLAKLSKRAGNLLLKAAADPKHLNLMFWLVTCQTDVRLSWARPIQADRKFLSATLAKMGLRVIAKRLGLV